MAAWTAARARNFGSIAELYERVRPGYPAEAVDWFLPATAPASGGLRIADVGTGTGKLTDALLAPGREVTAVDPDPGMLAVLSAKHPEVTTVTGTAEQLPFDDATFDAVTFGQSWHWVDPPRGSTEVARILRPGGVLGLFWNIRDAREPWVAELAGILGHQSADELMLEAGGPVVTEPLEFDAMREFQWISTIDVATLVDLAATHGFVITASEADRRKMLDAVAALGERVAGADGMLRLPYRLYAYRFRAA
ncbi:MAG: class I SAM-dependent methyltransferase [Pseudolysinimonas sp.]|uniref:class I SAM-dependent methyltransferase n=1 Tax=Pseudolysinimonas sp. TaxID=2680009 RepID=UPI003C714845